MADIKLLWNQVKQLIDDKNYHEVQLCCKKILEIDKNNYIALVSLGKFLGDSDEALSCFQKAIAYQPKKPLAWRGLANYYEGKDDAHSKSELLKVYMKILKLKINTKKAQKVISKVTELGLQVKDSKTIIILINYLCSKPAMEMFNFTESKLMELLSGIVAQDDERLSKVIQYISQKIFKDPTNDLIYILLGKVILTKANFAKAFEEITNLSYFGSNVTFRIWLCQYLLTIFAKHESFNGIDIEKHKNAITEGIPDSKYIKLLNTMILYSQEQYLDAYMTIGNRCIDFEQASTAEAMLMIKCTLKTRAWAMAEVLAKKFLTYATDISFQLDLNKYLFQTLVNQKKWKPAITAIKDVPLNELTIAEQAMLTTCYIENNENFDDLLESLKATDYYIQLKGLSLMKEGKYSDAIDCLENDKDNAVNCLYIGKSYWQVKQFIMAYQMFLRAIILDDKYAEAYFYIGKYYEHVDKQTPAQYFYEKAQRLDGSNIEILKSLSDFYLSLNLRHENFLLLRHINHLVIKLPWLHFRLGCYFREDRKWFSAIRQFKYVIQYEHDNILAYEYLAEAYNFVEFFQLSLETYQNVLELNPSREVFYLTNIANLQCLLEMNDEAILSYERILDLAPNNLIALKRLTNVLLIAAQIKENDKLYQTARGLAQTAVNCSIRAIHLTKKDRSFWKTIANAILFIVKLPDEYSFVNIQFGVEEELGDLGYLFMNTNMYKLIYYCFWRGQSVLSPRTERKIARELSLEIFDDEESADLIRYTCPSDLGLSYAEWVRFIERRTRPRPMTWL